MIGRVRLPSRRGVVGGALASALIFACALPAQAEWRELAEMTERSPDIAYDPTQIRYEPPYQTSWTRIILAAPATLRNGISYQSALQKVAVDCSARRWAVTYSEFYAGTDPRGIPLWFYSEKQDDWNWRPARAGSSGALIVWALCTIPRPW